MTDFFEPPPRRSEPDEEPEVPPWFQPPEDQLAALMPERRLLVTSDRLAVVLSHVDVYDSGCDVRLRILLRRTPDMNARQWADAHRAVFSEGPLQVPEGPLEGLAGGLPDELLRWGVAYRDGRKATTLSGPPPFGDEHPGDGPVLTPHGGGGGGGERSLEMSEDLWLWPLPPAEPFDLVVAWPIFGVPETRFELDGAEIVAASARVRPLFVDSER